MSGSFPTAVVLCGGLGTRLRGVIVDRPKVLADVGGRPFLARLLEHLASEGVGEVVLSAGHLAEQITAFVRSGVPTGLRVRVVVEPQPLGTAGAIRFAFAEADIAGPFFALNGDTYFAGSMGRLLQEHRDLGAVATMALAKVEDVARYGAIRFDADTFAVQAFDEKGGRGPGWINAGVYVLSPEAMAPLQVGAPASLERDVLPSLIGRGLVAVPFPDATFLDIGTPSDYAAAASILYDRTDP